MQAFAAFSPLRSLILPISTSPGYLAYHRACINIASTQGPRLTFFGSELSSKFMGQRREPRKEIRLPVRIFGTDDHGRVFSENVFTVDISRGGAKLTGVQSQVKPGEIIGMAHERSKGRFLVKWAGQPHTPQEGQIGLQNASPEKFTWDFPLPDSAIDEFGQQSGERSAE